MLDITALEPWVLHSMYWVSKESKTKKINKIERIFSTPHCVKNFLQKEGLGASRGKAAWSL